MNTAKVYAQALWEYLKEGETSKKGDVFIQLLKRRGHYKLLPTILKEFEKIKNSQEVKHEEKLTCAAERDVSKYRKQLRQYGIETDVAEKAIIEVDKNLIGGFRYENKNVVIDGCHRKKLLDLYREITA